MSECTDCKVFLDTKSISDRASYLKWLRTNHPDKFRVFGEADPRFINSTSDTQKATRCFPRWYGKDEEKDCVSFRPPPVSTSSPRAPSTPPTMRSPFRPSSTPPSTRSPFRTSSTPPPRARSPFSFRPSGFRAKFPTRVRSSILHKPCKTGYIRNRSTKRCRKSCVIGQRRSKVSGRCLKGRKSKKSKRSKRSKRSRKLKKKSRFVTNSPLGSCRGRKKSVCKIDPNCAYRKRIGCVKRRGVKKSRFFGPMMPDSGY